MKRSLSIEYVSSRSFRRIQCLSTNAYLCSMHLEMIEHWLIESTAFIRYCLFLLKKKYFRLKEAFTCFKTFLYFACVAFFFCMDYSTLDIVFASFFFNETSFIRDFVSVRFPPLFIYLLLKRK